ncbi:hypothetical protein AAFF_G00224090 [Aldrovandia affinis]|uniref:Uncharacterized protein n=1 Tax=Aldrovandia affinis TaxID=143900 RepID=A0AAD7X1E1_9TELE|nr:hypothetical protein AAFF_G00224090 [Aldrovandia affinis]
MAVIHRATPPCQPGHCYGNHSRDRHAMERYRRRCLASAAILDVVTGQFDGLCVPDPAPSLQARFSRFLFLPLDFDSSFVPRTPLLTLAHNERCHTAATPSHSAADLLLPA